MIPVTKPFLPPFEEYQELLRGVWERNHLTNNGPLVKELEIKVAEYLGVPSMQYVTNGTIALQLAIKALDLKGEIITTPFSYVATTSTIVWEGCTPVFVDIDPHTFNIDPNLIEAAITPRTSAILATHVFGNPCDVEAIQAIAEKHNLKVIYDGAHAFGTKYKGESIFKWGDISTCSFHATKLFHTIEGGAVFSHDSSLVKKIASLRNFGHQGYEHFDGVGINGKNSEFHAAMGLLNLKHVENIVQLRKALSDHYQQQLAGRFSLLQWSESTDFNFAYFPVLFESEKEMLEVKLALEAKEIFPRRYFYPSLTQLPYVTPLQCEVADSMSPRILCLPLYYDLKFDDVDLISQVLLSTHYVR